MPWPRPLTFEVHVWLAWPEQLLSTLCVETHPPVFTTPTFITFTLLKQALEKHLESTKTGKTLLNDNI